MAGMGVPFSRAQTGATLALLLLLLPAFTSAEEITLSTGERLKGILRELDADGAARIWVEDRGMRLGPGRVVQVVFGPAEKKTPPFAFVAHLAGGSRLIGMPGDEEEKGAVSLTGIFGPVRIPFDGLRALGFAGHEQGESPQTFLDPNDEWPQDKDALFLAQGDRIVRLDGVVEVIGKEAVKVWVQKKRKRIPVDVLRGIVFATPKRPDRFNTCGQIRALLKESSRIEGRIEGLAWGTLRIRTPSGLAFTLPQSILARLDLATDRRLYLSDATPLSVTETPFFNLAWPFKKDRSVGGNPLRIGGIRFAKGIGVHSRCRLVYHVPEGFQRFLAFIGIDDETGGKGNAVFRVYLGQRLVLEVQGVRGGDGPRPIDVPLEGAGTLTLEVDFGEGMDVGDHGDWAKARLVKD
jgi:hypothetical protein